MLMLLCANYIICIVQLTFTCVCTLYMILSAFYIVHVCIRMFVGVPTVLLLCSDTLCSSVWCPVTGGK